MIIQIAPDSALPPYEQIRQQVTRLVVEGRLAGGFRLPTIRQLAGDLGIAPGTVARAYRELEADGVVMSRGRHGTFTRAAEELPVPADADRQLELAAQELALTARRLGLGAQRTIEAVRQAFDSPANRVPPDSQVEEHGRG